MKKKCFRIVPMILLLVLVLSFCGCGKKDSDEKGGNKYVYTTQFEDIDISEDAYVHNFKIRGDYLYYLEEHIDYEVETHESFLVKRSLIDGTKSSFSIPLTMDSNVMAFAIDNEGFIYCFMVDAEYDKITYETIREDYLIVKYDGNGNKITDMNVNAVRDALNSEYFYANYFVVDDNGYMYGDVPGDGFYVLDKEGKILFTKKDGNWIEGIGMTGDGTVLVAYHGDTPDGYGFVVRPVDVNAKDYGKELSDFPTTYMENAIFAGEGKEVYVAGDKGIVSYDTVSGNKKEIFNWLDCNIVPEHVYAMGTGENGNFYMVNASSDASGMEEKVTLVSFIKKDSSEVTAKKELVLGGFYVGDEIKKQVVEFNKANEEYKITVMEYGIEDLEYEDCIAKLNNDILAGKIDMLMVNAMDNLQSYIAKGLLEDLRPYLDEDKDFDINNYVENILTINKTDKIVYALTPSFSIETFLVKDKFLNGIKSWTLEDVRKILEENPQIEEFSEYFEPETIFTMFFIYNMDRYIDFGNGTCNLNSQEFIDLLEFSKNCPYKMEYDEDADYMATYREDKTLALNVYISGLEGLMYDKALLGEPATLVGFPVSEGSGHMASSDISPIAIFKKSKYKDAAWEFIKMFFSEENQKSFYGLPVHKKVLKERLEEDMKPDTYEDESGNLVEYENTMIVNGVEITIPVATKKDYDELMGLIESIDATVTYDINILQIIEEELPAFFEGKKQAKDIAEILQSRVNLYLNEIK